MKGYDLELETCVWARQVISVPNGWPIERGPGGQKPSEKGRPACKDQKSCCPGGDESETGQPIVHWNWRRKKREPGYKVSKGDRVGGLFYGLC